MQQPVLTLPVLIREFKALGLAENDTVLAHSSLSAFGRVAGGAGTVIDALREVLGRAGTLMMASFQTGGEYALVSAGCVFDVRVSPTEMGAIPETFRKMPGVRRSLSPTHCMAACGKNTKMLLEGHEFCRASAGKGSPFEKLIQAGGKILLLGVKNNASTTLHYLENVNGAPTLSRDVFNPIVIDYAGRARVVPTCPHMPGLRRRYLRVEEEFTAAGIQVNRKIGAADCRLIDARKMEACLAPRIRHDPLYLIETLTA